MCRLTIVLDRDRSRSPPQRERRDDRRRDRSPVKRGGPPPYRSDRDRDRDYQRGRDRQPSGTPPPRGPGRHNDRNGPRQPLDSRANNVGSGRGVKQEPSREIKMEDRYEDEDSEAEMQRVMGFGNFRSTKNTKVPGNDKNYGVHKLKKTEYRQYMNRVGGFNRPLSPTRM